MNYWTSYIFSCTYCSFYQYVTETKFRVLVWWSSVKFKYIPYNVPCTMQICKNTDKPRPWKNSHRHYWAHLINNGSVTTTTKEGVQKVYRRYFRHFITDVDNHSQQTISGLHNECTINIHCGAKKLHRFIFAISLSDQAVF